MFFLLHFSIKRVIRYLNLNFFDILLRVSPFSQVLFHENFNFWTWWSFQLSRSLSRYDNFLNFLDWGLLGLSWRWTPKFKPCKFSLLFLDLFDLGFCQTWPFFNDLLDPVTVSYSWKFHEQCFITLSTESSVHVPPFMRDLLGNLGCKPSGSSRSWFDSSSFCFTHFNLNNYRLSTENLKKLMKK